MDESELYKKQELLSLPENYTYTGEQISSCAKKVALLEELGSSDFLMEKLKFAEAHESAGFENTGQQKLIEKYELFIRQRVTPGLKVKSGGKIVVYAGTEENLRGDRINRRLSDSSTQIELGSLYLYVGVGNVYPADTFFRLEDRLSREEIDERVRIVGVALEAELMKLYHEQHPATKTDYGKTKMSQPIVHANPAIARASHAYLAVRRNVESKIQKHA